MSTEDAKTNVQNAQNAQILNVQNVQNAQNAQPQMFKMLKMLKMFKMLCGDKMSTIWTTWPHNQFYDTHFKPYYDLECNHS